MTYKKTNFVDDQILEPYHLNNIEDGIINNENAINENKNAINNKQDLLISGENIKTINGISLLGSNDINIEDLFGENSKALYDGIYHFVSNYGINTGIVDMNVFNKMITDIGSGVIVFDDGTYLFPNTINLPSNITLKGSSRTILKLTSDSAATKLIYIGENIDNVKLIDLTLEDYNTTNYCPTSGTKVGIEVYKSLRVNLERVNVIGFNSAGLKATYMAYITSTQMYYKQMQISNCRFEKNYYGLYLGYRCEYTQVSNTMCGHNNIGCFCGGGNNLFANSMFNNNTTGFIMESEGMQNPAHGGASNCGFNHNTSIALKVNKNVNGFTFMGCQFFHGSVQVLQSKGTIFDGCVFGSSPLTSTGALRANVISNSYFLTSSSTMLKNNDGSTYVFNCLPDHLCIGVGVIMLNRITVTYDGGDMPVGIGYEHLAGITVTAHYSDGTSKVVDDYTLSGETDGNVILEGENIITVTYGDKTEIFNVIGIASELIGISATYDGGDVIIGTNVTELTGITVIAKYENGFEYPINGYALSGTIVEGKNTITITYRGKSTTIKVTGIKAVDSIEATYSGGSVPMGTNSKDLTGIKVFAIFNDGSSKEVTGFVIEDKFINEGDNIITITYGGKSTTITVIGYDSWSEVMSITTGISSLASDLCIGNSQYKIGAGTPYDQVILPVNSNSVVGDIIPNVNIFIVDANTHTVLEHVVENQSATVGTISKYNGNCIVFNIGIKLYDVPTYLLIEADRTGDATTGKSLVYGDSGVTNSGTMINLASAAEPKAGDVLTMNNKLYVNHIVYYSGIAFDSGITSISATYNGGDVEAGMNAENLTGIVVTATLDDGSTEEITGFTIVNKVIEVGENIITITYRGESTTITVIGLEDPTVEVMSITTGTKSLASDLYIGNSQHKIDAGTPFDQIVLPVNSNSTVGDVIPNVNVFIVNANTHTVLEHVIENQSGTVGTISKYNDNCIKFDMDIKYYDVPTYLLIEADRVGDGTTGKSLVYGDNGATNSGTMINLASAAEPKVGDVLTMNNKLYINHIVYYSGAEFNDGVSFIAAEYTGGNVETGTNAKDINLDDITVLATFDDGSSEIITEFIIEDKVIVKGENIITITYRSESTTITVNGAGGTELIASITTGSKILASDLYIGSPSVVVPENKSFNYIVLPTKNYVSGDTSASTNIYIVRQDTHEIIEHVINNQTATVVHNDKINALCIEFDIEVKKYDYPVYLLIESDRIGSSTSGKALLYGSAASNVNFMVSSSVPAVGDILSTTGTATAYYINHLIYYKESL